VPASSSIGDATPLSDDLPAISFRRAGWNAPCPLAVPLNLIKEQVMADRDDIRREGVENEVEGTGKDVKGRVKDAVGGLTGDSSLQAEGKIDRVKGKVQKKVGEIQNDVADEDKR
jgi:uncharacterized protein YjbJ (UPF0337 family)